MCGGQQHSRQQRLESQVSLSECPATQTPPHRATFRSTAHLPAAAALPSSSSVLLEATAVQEAATTLSCRIFGRVLTAPLALVAGQQGWS